MANYGIIRTVDGKEIISDQSTKPTEQFHPDYAKLFVSIPNTARQGYVKNGTKWEAPIHVDEGDTNEEADSQSQKHKQQVTKGLFFLELTRAERVAYKAAVKAGDKDVVNDLETCWEESGDIWLFNHASNPHKDVLTDLKALGILTDATIAKLTTIHKLDKAPPEVS